jgi:hypothetical protein
MSRGTVLTRENSERSDRTIAKRAKKQTILFVDDYPWDNFFQLAAGLRRAGFRTVRVSLGHPKRSEMAFNLLFDRTIVLGAASELPCLVELLYEEDVVDIHCADALTAAVCSVLTTLPSASGRERWSTRAAATDKFVVSKTLAAEGIKVPDVILCSETTPDEAARVLGLPIVVKQRRGSGGGGVRVIDTVERLRAEAADFTDEWFYERFVTGKALQYGTLAGHDGVRVSATYETALRKYPRGPASVIESIDDPSLSETGARVISSLGLCGLVNINVIRDDEGVDWVHDVNPRAWGSFLVFRPMGVDFLTAYIEWLRTPEGAGSSAQLEPARRGHVFPAALGTMIDERRPRAVIRLIRWSWPYFRLLGTRYLLFEIFRHRGYLRGRDELGAGSPP